MLEAVNSVLQTAPLVKANAEQVSTVDSFAANPNRVQKTPQVPYLSPYFSVDSSAHIVLQIRDPQTGKVLETYPSSHETQTRNATQHAAVQPQGSAPQSASGASQQAPAPSASQGQPATTRQIAAFTTAAQSGSGEQPTGSQVTVFA